MDPISALALAGNIIRFLEFGFKIITNASNIHDAWSGVEYSQLQTVTKDLHDYTEKLRWGLAIDEPEFRETCEGCLKVADTMLEALSRLQINIKNASKWRNVTEGLRWMLGKGRIAELNKQLALYSSQMDRRLLMLTSERVDITVIKQRENYHNLDRSIQTAIERMEQLEKQGFDNAKAAHHVGERLMSSIQTLTADNREKHDATQKAIAEISTTFQRDCAEVVTLAKDCLERFKAACMENQQYQKQALTIFEQGRLQGREQIDELKQEILLLQLAIAQSLQQIRNEDMSSEEERRVKATNNGLYNLWVAKELVLRNVYGHLRSHVGDWMSVLDAVSSRVHLFSHGQRQGGSSTELDNWGTNSELEIEFSGLPELAEISSPPRETTPRAASPLTGGWNKACDNKQVTQEDDTESWRHSMRSISGSDWGLIPSSPDGSSSWVAISAESADQAMVHCSPSNFDPRMHRVEKKYTLLHTQRSCVRCKGLRMRCFPDQQKSSSPCLACHTVGPNDLLCLWDNITDCVLNSRSFFTAESEDGDDKIWRQQSPGISESLCFTQLGNAHLVVSVLRTEYPHGLRKIRSWSIVGRSLAIDEISRYIDTSTEHYMNAYVDGKDKLALGIFSFALQRSLLHEQKPLLQSTLRFWTARRLFEGRWRCGLSNQQQEHSTATESQCGIGAPDPIYWVPLPGSLEFNLLSLAFDILDPLRQSVLQQLESLIRPSWSENWVDIFLVSFILLHNYDLQMQYYLRIIDERKLRSEEMYTSFLGPLDEGARTILANFHFVCREYFNFTDDTNPASSKARRVAPLDPEEAVLFQSCREQVMKKGPDFDGLHNTNDSVKTYWYTSQLFERRWRPRDIDAVFPGDKKGGPEYNTVASNPAPPSPANQLARVFDVPDPRFRTEGYEGPRDLLVTSGGVGAFRFS